MTAGISQILKRPVFSLSVFSARLTRRML